MSQLETRTEKPALADDFSAWYASWNWTWKVERPRQRRAASLSENRVACSRDNLSELPALSPKAFLQSISAGSSSSSPSSTPPSSPSVPSSTLFTTEYFEVKPSLKKGMGAFVTKNIAQGTIIITEKPLIAGDIMVVYSAYESLSKVEKKEYRSLYGYPGVDSDKLLAIFKTNRFVISGSKSGIFPKCSRFNHSCHPYATCTYSYSKEQGRLIVTTLRDIEIGEEITISYCGYGSPSDLNVNYGFYCDCPNCPLPKEAAKEAKYLSMGF